MEPGTAEPEQRPESENGGAVSFAQQKRSRGDDECDCGGKCRRTAVNHGGKRSGNDSRKQRARRRNPETRPMESTLHVFGYNVDEFFRNCKKIG